ncbi:FAD-binding protein [Chloroflexota bacterium]
MSVDDMPNKWDHETDVIIVGGGTAGLPASIKVAEAGLKATVLETRKMCGGSCRMAWGSFNTAGSEEQKERGIEDNPEILYNDMVNVSGADPDVARAYADHQLEAYEMVRDEGVRFPGVVLLPGHSKPRGLGSLSIGNLGLQMINALENRAKRKGVEILSEHRATRLIIDPAKKRVAGVVVQVKGETKKFKANKAVILTSGGFGRNAEMVREYAPDMVNCVPVMPPSHMGDGLKMGLAVGAATQDIGKAVAPAWPIDADTHSNTLRALNFGGIMVSAKGERFADESYPDSFYGPMTGAGMMQEGGFYYTVYTQKTRDDMFEAGEGYAKGGGPDFMMALDRCKQIKADSIEELAKAAGIDTAGLKKTIDKYNADIDKEGHDTVFGRKYQKGGMPQEIFKLDTAPFYAVKCVTAVTSMKGGLRINGRGQVLNQYGEVIPGLYAGGEVTGGLCGKTYLLGVMTSASMAQGIAAGINASQE